MPSELEFHLPLSREDLLRGGDPARYVVRGALNAAELNARLDECSAVFTSTGPAAMEEWFNVFFTLLQKFLETPQAVRERYWSIAVTSLHQLVSNLSGQDLTGVEPAHKKGLRNTLKMLVYVVTQLVDEFENEATKPDSQDVARVKGRRGGKKGQGSSSLATKLGLDWARERKRTLDVLLQLVEQEVVCLWEPPSVPVMEDFSNLIAGCCYKLLENLSVARDKALMEQLCHTLAVLVKRYGQALSVSLKLIQLLQHFEHLVSPLAMAVGLFVNQYDIRSVLSEMVRELGGKSPRDLALDNTGTRSFAAFLMEVSQSAPAAMLPNLAVLLPHLHGESYTFRNGVLSVLGEVVCKCLSSANLDAQLRNTRDQLLNTLEEHVHDVNAFVRSKTLQIWAHLCTEKAIPLPRQQDLLQLVSGRLKDKSSNVRKNAVQLLRALLSSNPFAAKLHTAELEGSLRAEEEKLKELLPEDTPPEPREGGGASEGGEGRAVEGEAADVLKQMAVVQYLRNALKFTQTMSECVPVAAQLLGSKVVSDVLEALEFLATSYSFEVSGSHDAVRKALVLVWSREQQVREAVLNTYIRLYLQPQCASGADQTAAIVRSLLSLVGGASYGELASLEELVSQLSRGGHLSPAVVRALWEVYRQGGGGGGGGEQDARGAVQVLSMAAESNREIVSSNVDILIQRGLATPTDLILAKLTCQALQKLAEPRARKSVSAAADTQTSSRLPRTHPLFTQISSILLREITNLHTSQWCPFAEQAVATIFKLSEQPDRVCGELLCALAKRVFGGGASDAPDVGVVSDSEGLPPPTLEAVAELGDAFQPQMTSSQDPNAIVTDVPPLTKMADSVLLSRLLFAVGHVAQYSMLHIEDSLARELKKRRSDKEERGGASSSGHTPRSTGSSRAVKTPATNLRGTASKLPSGKTPGKTPRKVLPADVEEEELVMSGAAADDLEAELVRRVMDEEVGGGGGMLRHFEPIVVAVVTNPQKYSCPRLQTSAALTLAKFMLLSPALCDQYLQLLFTVLERSPLPGIRANTIVAVGDLTFRFPNLTEPWTPFIYARLRDDSPLVRKNAMTTLTHLILNDMVKVKGQISEMALCLEDPEASIADLAKLFFHELAKKGNSLYNILPDVISHLSDPQRGVASDRFRSIMKYLLSFIQKERQCESLLEKLLHRFRATRTDEQCHNLAHCLTEISLSERCLSKLADKLSCYQDRLGDAEVYRVFSTIVSRAKKSAKPDTKVMLEELERKMLEAHSKGLEEGGQQLNPGVATETAVAMETVEDQTGRGGAPKTEKDEQNEERSENDKMASSSSSPLPTTPITRRPNEPLSRSTVRRKAALPQSMDTVSQTTPPGHAPSLEATEDAFTTDALSSARKSLVRHSTEGSGLSPRRRSSRKQQPKRNRYRGLVSSSEEEDGEELVGKRLVLSDSEDD